LIEKQGKWREKNQEVLKETIKDREEIIERKFDKIRKQYEGIEERIRKLQDQRNELFCGAITKEEILANAKDKLREGRKFFIKSLLGNHLKACQERNMPPFGGTTMRVHVCPPDKAWQLFYFAVYENDLEEAIASLPDIGMPIAEREKKIKEIDKEISELQKILKDDLEAEKSKT
jgi:chaperonin cofactor prefoldin